MPPMLFSHRPPRLPKARTPHARPRLHPRRYAESGAPRPHLHRPLNANRRRRRRATATPPAPECQQERSCALTRSSIPLPHAPHRRPARQQQAAAQVQVVGHRVRPRRPPPGRPLGRAEARGDHRRAPPPRERPPWWRSVSQQKHLQCPACPSWRRRRLRRPSLRSAIRERMRTLPRRACCAYATSVRTGRARQMVQRLGWRWRRALRACAASRGS